MLKQLLFCEAKPFQHPIYGEVQMEVWRVIEDDKDRVREPKYYVAYYKNGELIDASY